MSLHHGPLLISVYACATAMCTTSLPLRYVTVEPTATSGEPPASEGSIRSVKQVQTQRRGSSGE